MNVDLTGKVIKILDHNEVLQKKDIVRFVVKTGDEGGFDLTYKQEGYNPLSWQYAEDEMPGWVNETIKNFNNIFSEFLVLQGGD